MKQSTSPTQQEHHGDEQNPTHSHDAVAAGDRSDGKDGRDGKDGSGENEAIRSDNDRAGEAQGDGECVGVARKL